MTRDPGTIARKLGVRFDKDGLGDPSSPTPLRAPAGTLGRHLLGTVMTTAQIGRFRCAPGLRVVIEAPTPAWVEPLLSAAVAIADWDLAVAMDGTSIRSRHTRADEDPIAQALDAGHRIVAVSHAPGRLLPPSLIACADMRVHTGHPTSAVIRMAIRDATGFEPGITSGRLGDRLDFFDLVGAIRVGSDVRTCLGRLGSATANRAVVDRFATTSIDLASLDGYGEAAAWSRRLVEGVEAWRRGEADLAPPDGHAILCGPDGSGRSSLVTAMASSVGLPLIATRVPSWFVDGITVPDVVPQRVEVALARATGASPAILLLDAIDAIPGGPTVACVARFLDGIATGGPSSPKLIVVGTASHGDAVDPALLRPGRLSRVIEIPPPDEKAIPGILRQHLREDLDGVGLDDVVALACGSTGATIAGWVREARRHARVAGRPMAIGDLLAQASAPGNRAPGSWRPGAVQETFRDIGVGTIRPPSIRPVPSRTAGARGGRPKAASPSGKFAGKGAVIEMTVPTGPARSRWPHAGPARLRMVPG